MWDSSALVYENDRLLYLLERDAARSGPRAASYPDFEDWRAQTKSFSEMAAEHPARVVLSSAGSSPVDTRGADVSSNIFRLLGVKPILGREFTADDEKPGAAPVAILRYDLWEHQFGKDPGIIGRSVRINDVPTTVIGVMPPGFFFPRLVSLWRPLVQTPALLRRDNRSVVVIGRLAEDATIQSARAEMQTLGKRLANAYPKTDRSVAPVVNTYSKQFIGPNAATIYGTLWGAVGFVLLIACANVANLLLGRAMGRSREISIRTALGAGRWRIARQFLVESLILSSSGGLLGWLIAKLSVHAYAQTRAYTPAYYFAMDGRVFAYLAAISIATGLLCSLMPAFRLSKLDIDIELKGSGRGLTEGKRGKRLSAFLIAGEMALAVMLLAGAGLMTRSFLNVYTADTGIKTQNVLMMRIRLPRDRYSGAAEQASFYSGLMMRLEAIPGVESVAFATAAPTQSTRRFPYELADAPSDEQRRPSVARIGISEAYFRTLSAAVLEGRGFNDLDRASGLPVVIVNQRFAEQHWPERTRSASAFGCSMERSPGHGLPSWASCLTSIRTTFTLGKNMILSSMCLTAR